jgi:outer membrane protein OmpA-like peptidoglycan-associated protein
MAVHAERTRGRKRGAPRLGAWAPAQVGRRAALYAGLATVALLAAFAAPATAQQTLIIGGPAIIGPGAGGLTINNEVLESLGQSSEVPALPYQAPGGFGGAAPVMPMASGVMPGPGVGPAVGPAVGIVPGIAYRQPDTGRLLVTRPGRLLFPPPRAPRSRLAAKMPAAPIAKPEPELTSRLLVPPPPQSAGAPEPAQAMPPAPVEPVVETPVAAAEPPAAPAAPAAAEPEAMAPEPEPAPPAAAAAPEPQVAAQPAPSMPAPSMPEPEAPAPSTLTRELTQKAAPAEPKPEPLAEATAEPTPPPEPAVQPVAPPPEPAMVAPSAAETEPPPPPAESLTSEPAVEPQTAALPPAPALGERIRVLFQDGSVELGDDAKRRLSAVATALNENTTMRVQLLAYAKASSDGASRARRLSLSRALAVRAYLIELGVRSTRMDVRALGDKIGDGPADRVDILPQASN